MAEMSSVTILNSVLWCNRLTKCSSIVKRLKKDLTVHLWVSGTHRFTGGNTSHCIFIGCLSVCLCCKSGGRAVKVPSFISRILPLTPLAFSRFILGPLREAQSHEPRLSWLPMKDVYGVGSPPPQILQSEVQQMAVLSSHALSTGGNSLGFADKNSSSFKVGLC